MVKLFQILPDDAEYFDLLPIKAMIYKVTKMVDSVLFDSDLLIRY